VVKGTTQQFSTSATWSDGGTRTVAVTYAATGGTITSGGLYTAGQTTGNYRVIVSCTCGKADTAAVTITDPPAAAGDTVFKEGFESNSMTVWEDGYDASLHKILTDGAQAHSGSRYLEITYPSGSDGGWLTKFFMPGYNKLRVSVWFRLGANWQGNTKLIALRGSRTDNQWSSIGQAGKCPTGTDFFDATVFLEAPAPKALRFYTYYPGMPVQSDGVTCWGVLGNGNEQYWPSSPSKDVWHQLEIEIQLNTPGQSNGYQRFWVDGTLRGEWLNLALRTGSILRLNSFQISASANPAVSQTQKIYWDDIVVVGYP
jgi:hypothetical protein